MIALFGIALLAALAGPAVTARTADAVSHQVPPGFAIESALAVGIKVRFPMFGAFDDRGRLFVAEASGQDLYEGLRKQTRQCRIVLLEDRDGDGLFDRHTVFADKLVYPMGLAFRSGKLYVADPPDLVAFSDTDDDGRADRRDVILSGFGHTDNGSLHGLVFGPDDLLYMTMGRPDGFNLRGPDGRTVRGETGALIRSRADGTGLEIVSLGFDNLVEVAFLPTGEIIGTDNWYQLPKNGMRDALVHLTGDGRYPDTRRNRDGDPAAVSPDLLPPLGLYPAVAHSGLVAYRGQAFPTDFRTALFAAEFNTRKVVAHRLSRSGATFVSEDVDFVTSDDPDFHPADVIEDADGSLLVLDTGSWYVHHCPTGRIRDVPVSGGIFRIRHGIRHRSPDPIVDPWGITLDWGVPTVALAGRLADPRPPVRDRARKQLAGQEDVDVDVALPVMIALARTSRDLATRTSTLWALSSMTHPLARKAVRQALSDRDADIAAVAARALERRPDPQARPALRALLRHRRMDVRMAAAEALASNGDHSIGKAAIRALGERELDAFMEHALLRLVHRWASDADLRAALGSRHPRIQKAALWHLDGRPSGLDPADVLARATATDSGLRRTAQTLLARHPEWAAQVFVLLRGLLQAPQLSAEQGMTLRELIPAFSANDDVKVLIGNTLAAAASVPVVNVLVDIIMARPPPDGLPPSWQQGIGALLSHPQPELRAQAVRAVGMLGVSAFDQRLRSLAHDGGQPARLRVEALRIVVRRAPSLSAVEFEILLDQLGRDRPGLDRLSAVEVLAMCHLLPTQVAALLLRVRGDAIVPPATMLAIVRRVSLTSEIATALRNWLGDGIGLGWVLPPTEVENLKNAIPREERVAFAPIFTALAESTAIHLRQMTEYQPLLSGGSSIAGESLFFGKAACGACHRVGPRGGMVGPDLTKIGAIRASRDLLESLVAPSATFAQGYDAYVVTTKDGAFVSGTRVSEEPDSLTLRDASGAELRVRSANIEHMEKSPVSLMPEGLLGILDREEIRNLFAFLQSLR